MVTVPEMLLATYVQNDQMALSEKQVSPPPCPTLRVDNGG